MYADGFHFPKKEIDLDLQFFTGQSQASAEGYKENIPKEVGPLKLTGKEEWMVGSD